MDFENEIMECKKCGKCCGLIIDEVYDLDVIREPRLKPHLTECRNEPGRYFLKTPCPFLVRKQCSIYPTRPNICVAFEVGTNQCCPHWTERDKELCENISSSLKTKDVEIARP